MEPSQINGGRFYLRPLSDDDRIDDRPALRQVDGLHESGDDAVEAFRRDWLADTTYSWACCEATCVDMMALVTLVREPNNCAVVVARCVGDPDTLIDNPPDLVRVTHRDAAQQGAGVAARWAKSRLGLTVREVSTP